MTGSSSGSAPETLLAFGAVIIMSVTIVWFAARRTNTAADYFIAGGRIGAWANGLALAGDFVAAGGFLSLTGLIALHGADGMVFAIGVIFGWPLMLFLFAEPLRALGKFTLADVLVARLGECRLRQVVALNQLVIIVGSLTAQFVGASVLLQLLFGTSAQSSMWVIGVLTAGYVLIGGMLATTWLQIVKAALMMLIAAAVLLAGLSHIGFNPLSVFSAAVSRAGPSVLMPGSLFDSPWDTPSLLLGLTLGGASMPHVLMRMNTATSPRIARQGVFLGTGIIVLFHLIVLLLGFMAMVLVGSSDIRAADPGGNMALPLLAAYVGGPMLLGVVGAVALSTILAVSAGLGIAGAAALSHDLLMPKLAGRDNSPRLELFIGRAASVILMIVALGLASMFRGQNLAFLSALAAALAASANFPVLVLAIFYRRFTALGAIAGMLSGTLATLVLIIVSPLVQISVLGHPSAPFPLRNPGIITVPIAFLIAIVVSRKARKPVPGSDSIRVEAVSQSPH